jgi:signal transduction histidine kinase
MRRGALPLAALAILAELVLLSYRDVASSWPLAVHAAISLVCLAAGLRTRATAPRLALLAAAAAAAGLLALGAATQRSVLPDPDPDVSAQAVEAEARAAAAAFERFFASQREMVAALPPDLLSESASREEMFERLARFRDSWSARDRAVDLTIYDAGGEALAWVGETSVLDSLGAGLAGRAGTQFARKEALGSRLYTARAGPGGAASRVAVAEALLDAPFDPEAWRRRIALPASLTASLHAEFLDPVQADSALHDFLDLSGDLYWKKGGGASPQLLTGLHGKGGELLGLLTLSPEPPSETADRRARREAGARLLLLLPALVVLAAAAVVEWRRSGAVESVATMAGVVFAARLALSEFLPWVSGWPLYDYRLFSSPIPLRLAASPGDLLATCLTALALAALAISFLRRAGSAGRLAAGALGVAAAFALWRIAPEWISDSSLNPVLSPFRTPVPPRFALAISHVSLLFAAGLLLLAALAPKRLLSMRTLALVWLAAASLSFLALARQAGRVPPVLIERSLAPEVLRSREEARERLSEVLLDVREDPRWDLGSGATPEDLNRLTFEAWRASALGRTGSHSALALFDTSGRLLGSFAYGLPERIFADADSAHAAPPAIHEEPDAPPVLSEDALRVLRLQVPLLRGDVALFHEGRLTGRLAILLSREWDNLPFLTLRDPLLGTLGAGSREPDFDEYFGGAPLFLAYSLTGEVLYPAAERAAPLAPERLGAREPLWTRTSFEGHDYRTYLFQTPEGPRALGYAAPSALAIAAGLIRSLLASLIALAPILAILLLLTAPDPSLAGALASGSGLLAGSYYRRLLTVVLASSLVPLLLLAVIFRNTIERQSRDAFEREGVSASATIGRLLEDYAASAETTGLRGEPIESRTLFWIGRTVHQDVHLFTSDRLLATSRGDPEASGLRTFRLNAEVARTLARSRSPQFLANEPLSGRRAALIYALVRLEENAPKGVLAVPLVLQERVLAREAENVADALITATVCLGLLLSGIGYLFARRLSVPIRELSGAAATIASGRFDVRVAARGRDEIRRLVDAFNGMAGALSEQREDLRRRKDYIEAILLNVTTGVISTDAEGAVRTSNPAASLILDLPVELIGRKLLDELARRLDLAGLLALWSESPPAGAAGAPREISILRAGEEKRLRSVALPIRESDSGSEGRIFLVEDVTDVMRSNRLEAWAEMARGIAHEIKNPLTPIQLSAEHLLRVAGDGGRAADPVLRECVDTILAQVRALREISSDFSAYARLPVLRKEPADLPQIVRAALAPYRTSPPAGIALTLETESLPSLELDERVLRRALVNLVENALQAMEGGGRLSVTVRCVALPSGPWAEIVVADTGIGMDDATRARVFEPYFSTRDSGVGLGLAITRRAVEEHGGAITAESSPGRGTRMIIRLPFPGRTDPEPAARPESSARAQTAEAAAPHRADDPGAEGSGD